MSSLQALLDAQDQRKGSQSSSYSSYHGRGGRFGGSGGGGGRERGEWSQSDRGFSNNGHQHQHSAPGAPHQGGRQRDTNHNGSNQSSSSWSTNGRSNQARNNDGNRNNDGDRNNNNSSRGSRWGNLNLSNKRDTKYGNSSSSSPSSAEPTYEERRANIERRAIQDSLKFHSTNNNRGGGGGFSNAEDDFQSLLSWVGPLTPTTNKNNNSSSSGSKQECIYYQDRDKRYPFYTNERGYELLQQLMETNRALLQMNHELLEQMATQPHQQHQQHQQPHLEQEQEEYNNTNSNTKDVLIRIGQGLYAHKPTLRTKGVTWSTEEYSHPGLQRMYLRMKSIQRFTEIWCLLERCAAVGVFDDVIHNNNNNSGSSNNNCGTNSSSSNCGSNLDGDANILRIAAVGGGPGYELLATKLFFAEIAPNIQLELISMDLCPAWRAYVERLGFRFVEYDINNNNNNSNNHNHDGEVVDGSRNNNDDDDTTTTKKKKIDPIQAAGLKPGQLHFCIVSCLMIYCTNHPVLDMFRQLVQPHDNGGGSGGGSDSGGKGGGGIKAILVSERGERTKACTMMEELGGKVLRFIDQSNGMDERQALWCSNDFWKGGVEMFGTEEYEAHQSESLFPNVPYCEHKERRRNGGGGGGSRR